MQEVCGSTAQTSRLFASEPPGLELSVAGLDSTASGAGEEV